MESKRNDERGHSVRFGSGSRFARPTNLAVYGKPRGKQDFGRCRGGAPGLSCDLHFSALVVRTLLDKPNNGPATAAISWIKSRIDYSFSFENLNHHLDLQQYSNKETITSLSKRAPATNAMTRRFADQLQPAFHFGRRIFLVTIHWGGYFQSLVSLALAFPDESRFVTVRGRAWNDIDETKLWSTLNAASNRHVEVFKQKKLSHLRFFRTIARGAHVFVLYDVDQTYGRPIDVGFFGTQIKLGAGWVDLAHRFDSIVVFLNPETIFGDNLEIYSVYDSRNDRSIELFRENCSSILSKHIEFLLSRRSTIWFKWTEFHSFFEKEFLGKSATEPVANY